MNPGDKDKLNQCLDILDTVDLGLPLVWLWSWSLIKDFMNDSMVTFHKTEYEVFDLLVEEVRKGDDFSLEYGLENHYDGIYNFLINSGCMTEFGEDEDGTD